MTRMLPVSRRYGVVVDVDERTLDVRVDEDTVTARYLARYVRPEIGDVVLVDQLERDPMFVVIGRLL